MASERFLNKVDLRSEFALVIETSRRFLTLRDPAGKILQARSTTKTLQAIVGDRVTFATRGKDYLVDQILPRENVLRRQYGKGIKYLAANIDLLLIVSAVAPLFNVNFIDRVLAVASVSNIPPILLINKSDLGMQETESQLETYQGLGIKIVLTSTKSGEGLDTLREILLSSSTKCTALCGVSGVGKSSLVNYFIPNAETRTKEVSRKTGQGRQTTSQATAYLAKLGAERDTLLIDLPGLSTFGVGFLTKEEARASYPEFNLFGENCQYSNCFHLEEPNCGVKSGLEKGLISYSRYATYLDILQEIKASQPY